MSEFTLVIGNKNYSSWSLRGWLALEASGASYQEQLIPLDQPETPGLLAKWSPSRRVPVLYHGPLTIWDSLAIGEYLHELFPQARLWPEDREARAWGRCIAAEMHSGFMALREACSMDMRARGKQAVFKPDLESDIARVVELWETSRASYGHLGPYLLGAYSLADIFYAPVVSRFVTYGVSLPEASAAYSEALRGHPAYRRWYEAAEVEPWDLPDH
jgi:glutathione S-transferase